jgi:glycosyltransferase involved in cell wall biosynthesis
MLSDIKACVIIPTYNNEKTLERVIQGVLDVAKSNEVILVDDGCTDSTKEILKKYTNLIHILTNDVNLGKGLSLDRALKEACRLGFENAITIDSDGQHFPSDIPTFITVAKENPGAVIMGSRNMNQEGVPGKSSFGNKFSNFWFRIETGIKLPDTQTGYRLYPLEKIKEMNFKTTKFEFEIEIIVRLAWKNTPFIALPINVLYDKEERVSHFRPGKDFFRISVLNSILVTIALIYYYPKVFFSTKLLRLIKDEAIKQNETNFKKSISIAFGFFMGIVPIWGFQLLIGVPLSILFRMNKVLFVAAANISIPPMIPFIIYASLICGQFVLTGTINHGDILQINLQQIKNNSIEYLLGACVLALLVAFVGFLISFGLLSIFRKKATIGR